MPKGTELTEFEKGRIIGMHDLGVKPNHIATKIGCSPHTITHFLKRYKERGSFENAPRSGRPPKMTNIEKQLLINETIKNRKAPLHKIIEGSGINISETTARRVLHANGIYGHIAAKKPLLNPEQVSTRLLWCQKYKEWTNNDWKYVVFSDESSIETGSCSRRNFVWREKGERFNPLNTKLTQRNGRKSIMVWGCFAGGEKGPLVFMKPNNDNKAINGQRYVEILKEHLLPFRQFLITKFGNRIIFQDDNAPIHTARYTKEWLNMQNIEHLTWPAQSPDLNPIENIWKILKDNIQQRNPPPHKYEELKIALLEEWEKLDSSIFENVTSSMPRRIAEVINNEGYACRY